MTLDVYYCISIVYIDSLTSKTLPESFHKMLVRENSTEPSKIAFAEAVFVSRGTSKLQFVQIVPFFPIFPCFLWLSPLLCPFLIFFKSMLHLLASCQVTERLVAFFRREGDNLKSLQSSLHIYSLEVQTEVKKILFRETNWHWHWVKATTSCLPRPQCFETCVCRFSS